MSMSFRVVEKGLCKVFRSIPKRPGRQTTLGYVERRKGRWYAKTYAGSVLGGLELPDSYNSRDAAMRALEELDVERWGE
jgi:hypothetical protein